MAQHEVESRIDLGTSTRALDDQPRPAEQERMLRHVLRVRDPLERVVELLRDAHGGCHVRMLPLW